MKRLDIFGSKVTLNYKGEILYRTSFGGVIAVCLVSFLVLLFFRNVSAFKFQLYLTDIIKPK